MRLSPLRIGRIQSFSWGNWENEFKQAEVLGFTGMEWTIDSERFLDNLFAQCSSVSFGIKLLREEYLKNGKEFFY